MESAELNKTIYAVVSGLHRDYYVYAVFSTHEKAESYIQRQCIDPANSSDDYAIDRWNVDETDQEKVAEAIERAKDKEVKDKVISLLARLYVKQMYYPDQFWREIEEAVSVIVERLHFYEESKWSEKSKLADLVKMALF